MTKDIIRLIIFSRSKIAGTILLALVLSSLWQLNKYLRSLQITSLGPSSDDSILNRTESPTRRPMTNRSREGGDDRSQTRSNASELLDVRSVHGYRHPRRPFLPIAHIPHNCTVPSPSGKYARNVSLPVAVPHLILIGAQKSGTSTLQDIVDKHPQFVTPSFVRKFEPHFFDWNVVSRSNKKVDVADEGLLCGYREEYAKFFDISKITPNVSVVFEKTPSYMLYPNIPPVLDAVCTWKPKILAILRNPVNRAFSEFQMTKGKKEVDFKNYPLFKSMVHDDIGQFITNGLLEGPFITDVQDAINDTNGVDGDGILEGTLSIDEFVRRNYTNGTSPFRFPSNMTLAYYIERLKDFTGNRKGILYRGLYAPLLSPWVQQFSKDDRLMVLHFEEFAKAENEGRKEVVNEVLEFAGVRLNATNSSHGKQLNWTMVEMASGSAVGQEGNQAMRKLTVHSQRIPSNRATNISTRYLHQSQRRRARKLVWRFRKVYAPMPPAIREYLTLLFRSFNDFLPELLGEEWRDIWD